MDSSPTGGVTGMDLEVNAAVSNCCVEFDMELDSAEGVSDGRS